MSTDESGRVTSSGGAFNGNLWDVSIDAAHERIRELEGELSAARESAAGLVEASARLRSARKSIIVSLGRAAEIRDPYADGRELAVATLSRRIAKEMGLLEDECDAIEMAALVHDIGNLRVPGEILRRPSQLSQAEFGMISIHPQAGYEIVRDLDFGWPIADTVLQHHERMDGSGYPRGLIGEDISLAARVVAVADAVVAMAQPRAYRPALGLRVAVDEVRDNPEQYDPRAASACMRLYEANLIEV